MLRSDTQGDSKAASTETQSEHKGEYHGEHKGEYKADSPPQKGIVKSAKAETVLTLIKEQKVLAKVIPATWNSWRFNLEQFAHPNIYRPIRQHYKTNRATILNPLTGTITTRVIGERGLYDEDPEFKYLKKTSTTLLPETARIQFINSNSGYLCDIDLCRLHGRSTTNVKYVFKLNAYTNDCWWLDATRTSLGSNYGVCTLAELRSHLSSSNSHQTHNEILARLSKDALLGVFTSINAQAYRLDALKRKYLFLEWLMIDLPIFILTSTHAPQEYTHEQQISDIVEELKRNPSNRLLNSIIYRISLYDKALWDKLAPLLPDEKFRAFKKDKLSLTELKSVLPSHLSENSSYRGMRWMLTKHSEAHALEVRSRLKSSKPNSPKLTLSHCIKRLHFDVAHFYLNVDSQTKELKQDDLSTSLLYAIAFHQYDLAQKILATKRVNIHSKFTETSLIGNNALQTLLICDKKPDANLVRLLLNAGVNLTEKNKKGKNVLSLALPMRGSIGQEILTYYAKTATAEELKPYLQEFINLTVQQKEYTLAELKVIPSAQLTKALIAEEKPPVDFLKRFYHDDVHADALKEKKEAALLIAARKNQVDVLKFFFTPSATTPINKILEKYSTEQLSQLLIYLIKNQHYDLASTLLKNTAGISIDFQDSESEKTALHYLLEQDNPPDNLIILLCENSINLRSKDSKLADLLLFAMQRENKIAIKHLLLNFHEGFTPEKINSAYSMLLGDTKFASSIKPLFKILFENLSEEHFLISMGRMRILSQKTESKEADSKSEQKTESKNSDSKNDTQLDAQFILSRLEKLNKHPQLAVKAIEMLITCITSSAELLKFISQLEAMRKQVTLFRSKASFFKLKWKGSGVSKEWYDIIEAAKKHMVTLVTANHHDLLQDSVRHFLAESINGKLNYYENVAGMHRELVKPLAVKAPA